MLNSPEAEPRSPFDSRVATAEAARTPAPGDGRTMFGQNS